MFKTIRALFRYMTFVFKVNFYRAALAYSKNYTGTFTLNFPDGQHIFPIYLAEPFVNLLHTSSLVPGIVVCRKPKKDTIGTTESAFYCNRAFCILSDEEKLAAYFHEVGHLQCQHLIDKNNLTNNIIDSQRCELEADMFALANRHGIGLISFLTKMRDTYKTLCYKPEDRSVIRRVIANMDERIVAAQKYCDKHAEQVEVNNPTE